MSYNRGLISASQRDRVFDVMKALQLPTKHAVCNAALFNKARILQEYGWSMCCHQRSASLCYASCTLTALLLLFTRSGCPSQGLHDTTKARDGLQRMPLMQGIGHAVFVNDVTCDEVTAAAAALDC